MKHILSSVFFSLHCVCLQPVNLVSTRPSQGTSSALSALHTVSATPRRLRCATARKATTERAKTHRAPPAHVSPPLFILSSVQTLLLRFSLHRLMLRSYISGLLCCNRSVSCPCFTLHSLYVLPSFFFPPQLIIQTSGEKKRRVSAHTGVNQHESKESDISLRSRGARHFENTVFAQVLHFV